MKQLKYNFKHYLGRLAIKLWIIIAKNSLYTEPIRGEFDELALKNLMGRLYQNPSMQQYLDDREMTLIRSGMELFIRGKMPTPDWYAGQIYEIRRLRIIQRECYIRGTKGRDKIKKFQSDRKERVQPRKVV